MFSIRKSNALRGCVLVAAASTLANAEGPVPTTKAVIPERAPVTDRANGEVWADSDGKAINAHGGGVLYHDGTYYWFGEHRTPRLPDGGGSPMPGVHCYSSTDLMTWKDEGLALTTRADDVGGDIEAGCVIERPKVIYNAKSRQFVMWFHLELKGKSYSAARAAVAVSDSPTGPFKFVRSLRPNAGTWPLDLAEEHRTPLDRAACDKMIKEMGRRRALEAGAYARRDFEGGQMSRDMTLFVDPDSGAGYLVSASEENYTLAVHELNEDFTGFTGKWTRIEPAGHNEAPAVIKHDGKYYLLGSGCTGWKPNDARYLVADSMLGPWREAGNPCVGTNATNKLGPELTWGGQSTFILPRPDRPGEYVAMFDLWRPLNLSTSGYIWVPLKIRDEKMRIEWTPKWDAAQRPTP